MMFPKWTTQGFTALATQNASTRSVLGSFLTTELYGYELLMPSFICGGDLQQQMSPPPTTWDGAELHFYSAEWNLLGGSHTLLDGADQMLSHFTYTGNITLHQCAYIAANSNHSIMGFAWGIDHPVKWEIEPTYDKYFKETPPNGFGCKVYVSQNNVVDSHVFQCGRAIDVCLEVDFNPEWVVPRFGLPGNALCCQQAYEADISMLVIKPLVASIGGPWFAYRPRAGFVEECAGKPVAITKPHEQQVFYWGAVFTIAFGVLGRYAFHWWFDSTTAAFVFFKFFTSLYFSITFAYTVRASFAPVTMVFGMHYAFISFFLNLVYTTIIFDVLFRILMKCVACMPNQITTVLNLAFYIVFYEVAISMLTFVATTMYDPYLVYLAGHHVFVVSMVSFAASVLKFPVLKRVMGYTNGPVVEEVAHQLKSAVAPLTGYNDVSRYLQCYTSDVQVPLL